MPFPDASNHSVSALPHAGHRALGYQITVEQAVHREVHHRGDQTEGEGTQSRARVSLPKDVALPEEVGQRGKNPGQAGHSKPQPEVEQEVVRVRYREEAQLGDAVLGGILVEELVLADAGERVVAQHAQRRSPYLQAGQTGVVLRGEVEHRGDALDPDEGKQGQACE